MSLMDVHWPNKEIVHCRECKYMKPKEDCFGYLISTCEFVRWITINSEGFEHCGAVMADDYCSHGRRKEEDPDDKR